MQAVRASTGLQLAELKDYVGSLVSELQEKDAASRAAQQTILDQLARERAAFHTSLRGLQDELAAARGECARGVRMRSHLVGRVTAEWARRRKGLILGAWRAHVVRTRRIAGAEREAAVRAGATRLAASSMVLAEQRWRQRALHRAFVRFHTERNARHAKREAREAKEAAQRRAALRLAHSSGSTTKHRASHRVHHRSRGHRRPHEMTSAALDEALARQAPHPTGHAADDQLMSQPLPASPPPAAPPLPVPPPAAPPAAAPPLSERRTQYLEYLRSCLRSQRPPAPEVVELAHGDGLADGSLIALQIRTAEEQLTSLHGVLHGGGRLASMEGTPSPESGMRMLVGSA